MFSVEDFRPKGTTRFRDLTPGQGFLFGGKFYFRLHTSYCQHNAMRMPEGYLASFEGDSIVQQVHGRIVIERDG